MFASAKPKSIKRVLILVEEKPPLPAPPAFGSGTPQTSGNVNVSASVADPSLNLVIKEAQAGLAVVPAHSVSKAVSNSSGLGVPLVNLILFLSTIVLLFGNLIRGGASD
jgi:hypothetical protein